MEDTTPIQCERTLLQAVKSLYRDHSACVRVGAGMSPWFDIRSGVKQGCAMSAWLFNLYLNSCLQGVKQSGMGVKVGNLNVNCLLYADDAVLIASSEYKLQALVTTLKEGCEHNGISLNVNKIKVLIFERDEERTECKISVNGKILEQVNEVVYLGSMFSRDGRY